MAIDIGKTFDKGVHGVTVDHRVTMKPGTTTEPIRVAEFSLTKDWSSDRFTRELTGPAYTTVGGQPVGSGAVRFDATTGASGVYPKILKHGQ